MLLYHYLTFFAKKAKKYAKLKGDLHCLAEMSRNFDHFFSFRDRLNFCPKLAGISGTLSSRSISSSCLNYITSLHFSRRPVIVKNKNAKITNRHKDTK